MKTVRRRNHKGSSSEGVDAEGQEHLDPLGRAYFFQELPSDVRQLVFEGVRFRLSQEPLGEDVKLLNPYDLLHEEADHYLNCHNWKRTVAEWLQFAESGE